MRTAEEDSEALRVAHEHVDELTAEQQSLTAGTEQTELGRETIAARVRKMEVSAATRNKELVVLMRAVPSSKGRAALGEDRANSVKTRALESKKMSALRWLVEVLNWTFVGGIARIAGLVDAELVHVRWFITGALSGSKGTVSEAICDVHD